VARLAAGKEFPDAAGRSLKVVKVVREKGSLTLEVQVKGPGSAGAFRVVRGPKGVLVMRNGQREGALRLALRDAAGKTWQPEAHREVYAPNRGAGGLVVSVRATFRLKPGQAGPLHLLCTGPRPVVIDIPFTLRDVPLSAPLPPPTPRAD